MSPISTNIARRLSALALCLVALGCTELAPTAPLPLASPPATSASRGLIGLGGGRGSSLFAGLIPVTGLRRTVPLNHAVTVSKTIGAAGGTLSIPETGATLVVPAGALVANTTISMTARAGMLVAYDFAPHGTTFLQPLAFSQDLHGTNATVLSALTMKLAYYSDPSLLTDTGAQAAELLNGLPDLLAWTFTGSIPHFSGYIVTWGASAE